MSDGGGQRQNASPATVARVLVDSPLPQLDRLFDYSVPSGLADAVRPGIRVRVPIRSAGRTADAFVIEVVDAGDSAFDGALSEIDAVVSTAQVLTPAVWALARRVADRAAGTASDVLRLAIPKRQVRVEKAWLAAAGASAAHSPVVPNASAPPASNVLERAVTERQRIALPAVPRVVEVAAGGQETSGPAWVGQWATTLAAAAARALISGGSAILCVPDYRDQRQLVAALLAVLPADRIVELDARQSGPDRYRAFLTCLGTEPVVIVGNRSVVYAPAAELALIAVWDDGDPLHAEPLAPYVHSRDAALVRQELQGCALIFASHARSTEVERLVEIGFITELAPSRAVTPRVLPTAQQAPQDRFAAMARIPSTAWREARSALEHGPVLVQVARPGYAPRLACDSCGESAKCLRCTGPLSTRTSRSVPACLWCGALAAPWACANCGGTGMRTVGQGATRTADELGRAFPGIRVIIADGERPMLDVDASPVLVVATRGAEPIAAGGYRAVLLLDGERMLARASLRVGEDCLRWWSNAAALAAKGAPVVLVGVGGALAQAMVTWRQQAYASTELADRKRLRFPPAVRVATVTGDGAVVEATVADVAVVGGTDVLGPVELDDGKVRAIVRFDYADGGAVASALRARIVKTATARRRRIAGSSARTALPTLRVRFDDIVPFAE